MPQRTARPVTEGLRSDAAAAGDDACASRGALRIGTRVNATASEARSESEMVSAWSRISWPAKPSTKTTGRNTATAGEEEGPPGPPARDAPTTAGPRRAQ